MGDISNLFNVKGHNIVVTGGAGGIGLGYVEALLAGGANVTIIDLNATLLETETTRLQNAGFSVRGVALDITDHARLKTAIDDAASLYGRLDAIFANAGIDPGIGYLGAWVGGNRPRIEEGALENYSDARWQKVIDINLTSVFATLRAAATHMKKQGRGRMIVTTSAASIRCEPAIGVAYMAAKAGAAHLVRNIALEMAAYGITVNAIAPGMFVTNIGGGHLKDENLQKELGKSIPMHRVGFPADMSGLALFLASDASSYITGQQILIDGGLSLGNAD